MNNIGFLNFLNNLEEMQALEYASCNHELINILDIISEDIQFIKKIDLGVIFISPVTLTQAVIVDGIGRIVSLSLLLHAICECYKKTTSQNENAINIIRKKYLLHGTKTKLRLSYVDQEIYNKIIYGERLSGKEKDSPMFKLLHSYWSKIKSEKLQASTLFKLLQKVTIIEANVDNVSKRDLYYSLNKEKRSINQFSLIEDFVKNLGVLNDWESIRQIYNYNSADLRLFFKDFFITKFDFRKYNEEHLYNLFMNYFETMLQYMPVDLLIKKIKKSAKIYHKILNADINNKSLKQALVEIKLHKGEDTYAYLLNIMEDFEENNITEATFLEILQTVDEYLRNRLKNPNTVSFNELIEYLNAFITCK